MISFDNYKQTLAENSLYTSQAEKDAITSDRTKLLDVFYINFLMFLGLFAIHRTAGIKQYEQSEGKLYIDNISDTNHDVSLSIKLLYEQKVLSKAVVDRMTKLLVKIKGNQIKPTELDEAVIRQMLVDMHYTSHRGSPKINAIVSDFVSGSLDLKRVGYKLFKVTREKEYASISTEVRNIGKFYGQLFKKFGLDTDPVPVNTQIAQAMVPTVATPMPGSAAVQTLTQAPTTLAAKVKIAKVPKQTVANPGFSNDFIEAAAKAQSDDELFGIMRLYDVKKTGDDWTSRCNDLARALCRNVNPISKNSPWLLNKLRTSGTDSALKRLFITTTIIHECQTRSIKEVFSNDDVANLVNNLYSRAQLVHGYAITMSNLVNCIIDKTDYTKENIDRFIENKKAVEDYFSAKSIGGRSGWLQNNEKISKSFLEFDIDDMVKLIVFTYDAFNYNNGSGMLRELGLPNLAHLPNAKILASAVEKFAHKDAINFLINYYGMEIIAKEPYKNILRKAIDASEYGTPTQEIWLTHPDKEEIDDALTLFTNNISFIRTFAWRFLSKFYLVNDINIEALNIIAVKATIYTSLKTNLISSLFKNIGTSNKDKIESISAKIIAECKNSPELVNSIFSEISLTDIGYSDQLKSFLKELLAIGKTSHGIYLNPTQIWFIFRNNIDSLTGANLNKNTFVNLVDALSYAGNANSIPQTQEMWNFITSHSDSYTRLLDRIENSQYLYLVPFDAVIDDYTIAKIKEKIEKDGIGGLYVGMGPRLTSLLLDTILAGFDKDDKNVFPLINNYEIPLERSIKRINLIQNLSIPGAENALSKVLSGIENFDWGNVPSIDFEDMKKFMNHIHEKMNEDKKFFNKQVRESVQDSLQKIFLKIQDHYAPGQIDSLFNSFSTAFKKTFFQDMVQLAMSHKISESLTSDHIKPDRKLSDAELLTILKINGVNLSTSVLKAKDVKGDSYAEVKKNIEKVIDDKDAIQKQNMTLEKHTEEELQKMSVLFNKKYNKYRHGDIGLLIKKVFTVSIPAQESAYPSFAPMNASNGAKALSSNIEQLGPQFHGTQPIPASMIARFGFKVITQELARKAGVKYAGRMLGDGIYMSNVIDKCSQYMDPQRQGTGISRKQGVIGYLFELQAQGSKWCGNLDYGNGDWATGGGVKPNEQRPNLVSPEWAVKGPDSQCKIYKCYEVEIVHKSTIRTLAGKFGLHESYLDFLNEKREIETPTKKWASFTFMDQLIPVSRDKLVDVSDFKPEKFGKHVRLDWNARGPVVMIEHSEDISYVALHTHQFIHNKQWFDLYLSLLNK